MFRRLPAGDAPPFSFVLPKENGRARSKENRCVSKSYRWQVWTNTGVERDGAAEIQKSPAGCAIPLQTEIVLPRIVGVGAAFGAVIVWSVLLALLPLPGCARVAAANSDAGPYVYHPESKLEVSVCGGVLSQFRLCPAHPAKGYQLTQAPIAATSVLSK